MMPTQKPGKSVQDVGTPLDFLEAVQCRFGPIYFDLAASQGNAVAGRWYDPGDDSLTQRWGKELGQCWLNPPFGNIRPWVSKCHRVETTARILLLVPASVSTNWWADHVDGKARVYFVRPRIKFIGHDQPFPKDLALCLYGVGVAPGYETWNWKEKIL